VYWKWQGQFCVVFPHVHNQSQITSTYITAGNKKEADKE
jgi:hypothetical protein